jgi:hypothetical protein
MVKNCERKRERERERGNQRDNVVDISDTAGSIDTPLIARAFTVVTAEERAEVVLSSKEEKAVWLGDLKKFIIESNDKVNNLLSQRKKEDAGKRERCERKKRFYLLFVIFVLFSLSPSCFSLSLVLSLSLSLSLSLTLWLSLFLCLYVSPLLLSDVDINEAIHASGLQLGSISSKQVEGDKSITDKLTSSVTEMLKSTLKTGR